MKWQKSRYFQYFLSKLIWSTLSILKMVSKFNLWKFINWNLKSRFSFKLSITQMFQLSSSIVERERKIVCMYVCLCVYLCVRACAHVFECECARVWVRVREYVCVQNMKEWEWHHLWRSLFKLLRDRWIQKSNG